MENIQKPYITVGTIESCIVSHYNDPFDFYVRLNSYNKKLKSLFIKIQNSYHSGGQVSKIVYSYVF